jgi:hypothetical protein
VPRCGCSAHGGTLCPTVPNDLTAYALEPKDGGRLLALRSMIGLTGANPQERSTWIDIAYPGEWSGHGDGPFKLTEADFASCIEAFEAQANPIPGDYEHASLNPDGKPKPASMWIQALKVEDGHLKALAELTPEAADLVRTGAYKFNSGVFAFQWPDRKTAKPRPCVLRSVALTNDPFIDGQKPIALTARKVARPGADAFARVVALSSRKVRALTGGSMQAKITKADILAGLKQIEGDEMNPAQLEALLAAIAAMAAAKDPKTGEEPEVETPEVEMAADEVVPPVEGDMPLKAEDPKAEVACAAAPVAPPPPAADPVAMAAVEPPPPAPAAPPAAQAEADAGAMIASSLVADTGMGAAELLAAYQTNKDAVIAAIRGQGGAIADLTAAAAGTIASLSADVKELRASVVSLTAARDTVSAEDKAKAEKLLAEKAMADVDAELTKKGILPGLHASYRALSVTAPKAYRDFVDALPDAHTFPTGRSVALSALPPPKASEEVAVDEKDPVVVQFRAMSAHRPKAETDAAVQMHFGSKMKV